MFEGHSKIPNKYKYMIDFPLVINNDQMIWQAKTTASQLCRIYTRLYFQYQPLLSGKNIRKKMKSYPAWRWHKNVKANILKCKGKRGLHNFSGIKLISFKFKFCLKINFMKIILSSINSIFCLLLSGNEFFIRDKLSLYLFYQ